MPLPQPSSIAPSQSSSAPSQASAAMSAAQAPRQRLKPLLHRSPQVPAEQVAAPFATPGQALPQRPQLAGAPSGASQPLAATPSQSPKPAAQATPQTPEVQVGAALAAPGQALPQRPQFAGEDRVLVSHPSAAAPLQSAKVEVQVNPQAPPAQVAALAFAGTMHADEVA